MNACISKFDICNAICELDIIMFNVGLFKQKAPINAQIRPKISNSNGQITHGSMVFVKCYNVIL